MGPWLELMIGMVEEALVKRDPRCFVAYPSEFYLIRTFSQESFFLHRELKYKGSKSSRPVLGAHDSSSSLMSSSASPFGGHSHSADFHFSWASRRDSTYMPQVNVTGYRVFRLKNMNTLPYG